MFSKRTKRATILARMMLKCDEQNFLRSVLLRKCLGFTTLLTLTKKIGVPPLFCCTTRARAVSPLLVVEEEEEERFCARHRYHLIIMSGNNNKERSSDESSNNVIKHLADASFLFAFNDDDENEETNDKYPRAFQTHESVRMYKVTERSP